MTKISAIIIGYNEAKYITRCLNNCAKWADEVVYVDSFSTDGSDMIARHNAWSIGYRAVPVKFRQRRYDNTRDQRNFALHHATHEWRFILDVDEFLSPNLIADLPAMVDFAEEGGFDSITLSRHNVVDGVDMGLEPTIHLVKRGIVHGGHPLHAERAANAHHKLSQLSPTSVVEHEKTAVQWMERARIYWWMCPYTFLPNWNDGKKVFLERSHLDLARIWGPPGSEELLPPAANWERREVIDVMTEFMDAGLDKRLTAGYLEKAGLTITPQGWGRRS